MDNIEEQIARYEHSAAWHEARVAGLTDWVLLLTKWTALLILGFIANEDIKIFGPVPFYLDAAVWSLMVLYLAVADFKLALENSACHIIAARKFRSLAQATYLLASPSFRRAVDEAPPAAFHKE